MQEGTGRLDGNRLKIAWRTVEGINGVASGVTTYAVTTEGELHGSRTVDGY